MYLKIFEKNIDKINKERDVFEIHASNEQY